jgi:hypothetical protein
MAANTQKTRLRLSFAKFALSCLVLICAFAIKPEGISAQTPNPQSDISTTLSSFYHWYVDAVAKQHPPLREDRAKLETYVTKTLLQQIDKLINSPDGLEEDYFTKAQDYMDDWMTNIVVSDTRIDGKTASAIVTLGATAESKHRLALKLIQEGDSWKISRVTDPGRQTGHRH